MFIEILHKIENQYRTSLVNTDKIISFNPCYELKVPECSIFEYLEIEEMEKIPKEPLITDYPISVCKIVRYKINCDNDIDYDIDKDEYERIKHILI